MTAIARDLRSLWWLVQKDFVRECRARTFWLSTLVLGVLLVSLLAVQLDVATGPRLRVAGGLFWVTVFFCGAILIERSCSAEREEGCWRALATYPVRPAVIFFSKLTATVVSLCVAECVLLPLFAILADVPLLAHPAAIVGLAVIANVGVSAVGVLLGTLTSVSAQRGYLFVLLFLPLIMPVALGASEGTRLATAGTFNEAWWQWIELLGVFAVLYAGAGAVLFEFVLEE
jgi:ABC-type transport system involved in cytochrome c biogenesis permease component